VESPSSSSTFRSAADGAPVVDLSAYSKPSPKAGYRYAAIPLQVDGTPYDDGSHRNTSAFAFCAYPVDPKAGRWTFIIDESNTIFRKKTPDPQRIRKWPVNLAAEGWGKLD
jgi:hypothetical protein